MKQRAEYIIIGGGAIGTSIAWHLSRSGAGRVVLLEKGLLGGGSSGKAAGLTILQWANETDIRLVRESLDIYHELISRHQELKFHQSGLVYLASTPRQEEYLKEAHALLEKLGVTSCRLDRPDIRRQLGNWMRLDDFQSGLYTPDDGYLDPFQVVNAFAKEARRNKAQLYEMTPVTAIKKSGQDFEAETPAGTFTTPTLINAAGCWSKKVCALLGLKAPLKPYRTQIAVLKPSAPLPEDINTVYDMDRNVYFHGETGGLLLAGDGTTEAEENPDMFNQKADIRFLEEIAAKISHLIPGMADAVITNSWAGLCSATPDRMPLVGRIAQSDNFIIATGDNGYGFMRAGMLGRITAEIALNKTPSMDIAALAMERFQGREFADFKVAQGMGV